MHASGYEVYEEILNNEDEIIQEKTKIANINANVFEYDISNRLTDENSVYKKFNYFVKSIGTGYYDNSNLSNSVQYVKEITCFYMRFCAVWRICCDGKYTGNGCAKC